MNRKHLISIALLLSTAAPLSGCKGASSPTAGAPKAPTEAPAPAPEPAPAPAPLRVTVNDAPLELVGAVVYHQGTATRTLELSTRALACEEYKSDSREIKEGERTLRASHATLLQPDGTVKEEVTSLELDTRGSGFEPLPGITLARGGAEGEAVRFNFQQEVTFRGSEVLGQEALRLSLQGGGEAVDCGLRGVDDVPRRPQEGVTVTVAGRRFAIQGAILEMTLGVPHLRLTSGAVACDDETSTDLKLELGTAPGFGEDKLHVYMRGDMLPSQYNGAIATSELKIEADAPLLDNPDKGPRKIKVQGAFTLSDYKVEVRGEVEALNCLP